MLCRDVKRVVSFFIDGSLGEQKRRDVDSHLKACPECVTRFEVERRLRGFVKSRFARISDGAPERLRRRLQRSIRAFSAEWSRP
jgi:mycothiol system anti-sigma-R factor